MTTSLASPTKPSLSDHLADNLRTIVRLDAVVTIAAALEMIALPSFFVGMLGLGTTPIWAVRALGFEWLLFGLWLATLWNRPLTRGMARFAILVLGLNGLFILAAPLVFGLGYTAVGWGVTIGTLLFMDLVILAWWQLLQGRADGAAGAR